MACSDWQQQHAGGAMILPSFRVWALERMEILRRTGGHTSIPIDVQNIIRGPSLIATSYKHMYESGRHFRTWRTDHLKRCTTNSGIFLLSQDGDQESTPYCGIIQDILEVDYGSFTCVVLEATFYKSIMSPPRRASMILDECGFYRVDTTRVAPRGREDSDTLAFPSQVDQCMIVPMASLPSWSIIIPVFP